MKKSLVGATLLLGIVGTMYFGNIYHTKDYINKIPTRSKELYIEKFMKNNTERQIYEKYKSIYPKDLNYNDIRFSTEYTDYGKFVRTYQYDKYFREAQKEFGIENGLLQGLCMQESRGDILQSNSKNDGGQGVGAFSGGTARKNDLKVHGNPTATGGDSHHGRLMLNLKDSLNYNLNKLQEYDDRFNPKKAIFAMARFLKDLYIKNDSSWNHALSNYNRFIALENPLSTSHVRNVRKYQKYYNKHSHKRKK